jgi:hypothetical protein
MGASEIEVGHMYVSRTGIFARDVLEVTEGKVHYQQYDYPEGRPNIVTRRCSAGSLWQWAGRRLDDDEAEKIREIGRPIIREDRFRREHDLWTSLTDALVFKEFLRRRLVDRLFDLTRSTETALQEFLAAIPDEEFAQEIERRGLTKRR